jgi:ABC-type bacteriocin/lantibiotic exporter with double-glycine peptidase domain
MLLGSSRAVIHLMQFERRSGITRVVIFLGAVASQSFLLTISVTADAKADPADAEPMGCGEASVELIAAAFRREYDREAIRRTLAPGRIQETTLARIARAVNTLRLDAQVVRGNLDSLRSIDSPAILLLQENADAPIGHFVVVRWHSGERRATVFDPLVRSDPVMVEPDVLEELWTGYAVVVSEPETASRSLYVVLAIGGFAAGALCNLLWEYSRPVLYGKNGSHGAN